MPEQPRVLTLNEQIDKLGLKISRPVNIETSDNSLEALARAIEAIHHQTEDFVLDRIFEHFSNPDNTNDIEVQVLLDGSLRFYINLLEKIKANPALSEFFDRIHFRFVFKTPNGGMMTESTSGTGRTEAELIPIDDIWDTGKTAGLPLAIQLGRTNIGMFTYSKKSTSPKEVYDEKLHSSAKLSIPDSELIIFENDWLYNTCGMNSSIYPGDWEVNMYERLSSIPLTHISEGSFDIKNRDEYLSLLKSLITNRNSEQLVSVFTTLGQCENPQDKVYKMTEIHSQLVNGTNLPKFNIIEG